MDNKLLLAKAVTVLYRESLITGGIDSSADLVRTVLEAVKLPEINIGVNHDRDILTSLKQTALEMCDNGPEHEYEKTELLQRLRLNCAEDDSLYEAIAQGIEPEMAEGSLKRTVLNIRKALKNHFREQNINTMLMKASQDFKYKRSAIPDVKGWIAQLCAQLEPYQVDVNAKDPAIVGSVDLGDENSVLGAFKELKERNSSAGILQTGWQDINDMLQGGFRRGESWVLGALQHNYKTGFSLSVFKQIALYNKPVMVATNKKPLLSRISFEDELSSNLQTLYQSLKETETGQEVDVKDLTVEEMSAYVTSQLQVNGYHVKLLRVNPSLWTYTDICNKVIEYESEGYEVHLLMLDYLGMIPTTGCSEGPMGFAMQDMFKRLRNFCSAKKILLFTPHQLSSEAKQLVRDGHQDFVKRVQGGGYYRGAKGIDQEVDGELFIHIEKANKRAYLTIQRGKHRIPTIISDDMKYAVLPFNGKGGIRDDLNGERIGLKKVGADQGVSSEFLSWD